MLGGGQVLQQAGARLAQRQQQMVQRADAGEAAPRAEGVPGPAAGTATTTPGGARSRASAARAAASRPPAPRPRWAGWTCTCNRPGIAYVPIGDAPLARWALVRRADAANDAAGPFTEVVTELGPLAL
ncbi:hypothetical protein K1Y72_01680 [Actinomadura sp. PM05-2]|uniref:Uncharacterized protein n=1 Tax=Actinomadura parmotrematis TaxID=2864039 RepID=A0ABS7FN94_9ACTN|nr:hypothetical protein [Actinomadura parmotrematis]MBW8481062.1 hypothetical protein [Actinomadura parmotrematis]